ncbi:hypothetical protein KEM52_002574 [Ascosphaera acerosa]|nr:hypothetical protein KEM52_002574 [Ascosphaera acerosa]
MMEQKPPPLRVCCDPKQQEVILRLLHNRLCRAAFDWVARYQFPIPRMADRPTVTSPSDRTWNEWAYLLKRLATKRRIPARLLKDSHIKAFVPTMENAISVPPPVNGAFQVMDDRCILQAISAGIQVVRLIQDGAAVAYLTNLYDKTSVLLHSSRAQAGYTSAQALEECIEASGHIEMGASI